MLTLTTRGRCPKVLPVENVSADDYRLKQMLGQWLPAGTVCCYLGIANPFGFGAAAELVEVKLENLQDFLTGI